MKAELKRIATPDIDFRTFEPDDSNEFMFLLELYVGPVGGASSEQVQIEVCSPEWLRKEAKEKGPFFAYPRLIVDRYDSEKIRTFLVDYISRIEGKTWDEIGRKLTSIGPWEGERSGSGKFAQTRMEIRDIWSTNGDPETFTPPPNNEFIFLLRLEVGPVGQTGADDFQLLACSPEWLRSEAAKDGPQLGGIYLVVEDYDFAAINTYLTDYVSAIRGSDWKAAASELGRVTSWDFGGWDYPIFGKKEK